MTRRWTPREKVAVDEFAKSIAKGQITYYGSVKLLKQGACAYRTREGIRSKLKLLVKTHRRPNEPTQAGHV